MTLASSNRAKLRGCSYELIIFIIYLWSHEILYELYEVNEFAQEIFRRKPKVHTTCRGKGSKHAYFADSREWRVLVWWWIWIKLRRHNSSDVAIIIFRGFNWTAIYLAIPQHCHFELNHTPTYWAIPQAILGYGSVRCTLPSYWGPVQVYIFQCWHGQVTLPHVTWNNLHM